jgi:hypothetical protein
MAYACKKNKLKVSAPAHDFSFTCKCKLNKNQTFDNKKLVGHTALDVHDAFTYCTSCLTIKILFSQRTTRNYAHY